MTYFLPLRSRFTKLAVSFLQILISLYTVKSLIFTFLPRVWDSQRKLGIRINIISIVCSKVCVTAKKKSEVNLKRSKQDRIRESFNKTTSISHFIAFHSIELHFFTNWRQVSPSAKKITTWFIAILYYGGLEPNLQYLWGMSVF